MVFFRNHHDRHDQIRDAPAWALILMLQNEAILAKLEQRPCNLSPEDQKAVNELFAVETADKAALDKTLK